ncbi:MAG: hypothetical protein IJ479_04460, partial [Alphaproteobacteria bacterium]|nr:hypothetical protein [Alphaproteobacteria bacterium]
LKKNSGRCSYDSSYGTCCTPSGCPSNTSLSSSSYGTNGTDGCEYTCYYTCNPNCPSGTSTSNPGGCGGSTRNGCNTKTCYYPYQSCCTPNCSSDSGCSCGTYTVSDGCGGTCTKCSSCCNSSSSNWCSYHGTCHGDCCKDGTWDSCDERCGGSGCSSSGGSSGGGSSCGSCSSYTSGHGQNRTLLSSPAGYWVCTSVSPCPGLTCWDPDDCRRKTCDELGYSATDTGGCTKYKPDSDSVTCYIC